MSDKPAHLCLTCNLAEWHMTFSGILYPDGRGYCMWKPIPTPRAAAWKWNRHHTSRPDPNLGWIERFYPITDCETYEAKP